jgi:hypothetical protein
VEQESTRYQWRIVRRTRPREDSIRIHYRTEVIPIGTRRAWRWTSTMNKKRRGLQSRETTRQDEEGQPFYSFRYASRDESPAFHSLLCIHPIIHHAASPISLVPGVPCGPPPLFPSRQSRLLIDREVDRLRRACIHPLPSSRPPGERCVARHVIQTSSPIVGRADSAHPTYPSL